MATITITWPNPPIHSVTFNGVTKAASGATWTVTATASISTLTISDSTWSGTIQWDTVSSFSDPYTLATVSNGVVSMVSNSLTYTGSDRHIYIRANGSSSGGGTTYTTNLIYFRTGTGISSYKMQYANSTSTGNTVTVTGRNTSTSAYVRRGTNATISNIVYENDYGAPFYFGEYTDSSFSTLDHYFSDNDNEVYSSTSAKTRYIKLFATKKDITYKYRIHAMTTADESYFSGGSQDYYAPSSSSWYTSDSVSNTFDLDTLPTPIRAYYKFVGWAYTNTTDTNQAHTGKVAVSGTIDGKVNNFYAVWSLAPTIILSANGGKFQDTQSTTKEYPRRTPGDPFYFSAASELVARNGYKLLGWSANDTATTAGYDPDGWVTVGNSTVQRYYAVWQKTEATITLYGNGGLWGGNLQYRTVKKNVGDILQFADYGSNATPPLQRAYYTLAGWSANPDASPDNPTYGANGYVEVGATDAKYYAIWKHRIELFYWDGNTGSTDSSIIAKGLPVTNLTAARWNRLKAKIKEVSAANGVIYTYNEVVQNQAITATEYNGVRNAIYNIPNHGALPGAKTVGSEILASYFNGPTSLKSALNAAIVAWNNS